MVSITKTNYKNTNKNGTYFIGDLAGLSTDSKPKQIEGMKVGNGCTFFEMNTGKIFFYDLENEQWKEI